MKNNIPFVLLLLSALAIPSLDAFARESIPPEEAPATVADESDLQEHGHYTNSSGKVVHSPAQSKSGAVPAGASAQCGDGTYSFSAHRRGTCSHHGGVLQWLN